MSKILSLSKSVFELSLEYPEVVDIMKELCFDSIANPAALKTVGRFMTIPKGADMKGIPLEKIKEELVKRGYQITS